MTRLGMDVDGVETMGRQLKTQAQSVRGIIRAVDGQISTAGSHWWGGRGRAFVAAWRSVHRPALLGLADAVDELGGTALRNVTQQRTASSRGSTPGGAPTAAPAGVDSADPPGDAWAPHGPTRNGLPLPAAPGLTDEARTLKALAAAAYPDGAESIPDGWELRERIDFGDGLSATLFQDVDGRYVLAYRGSHEGSDWSNNIYSHIAIAGQQEDAVRLALGLRKRLGPDARLEFTGHSLGGALAAVSSLATGDCATTFNAAGVDPETARFALARGAGPSFGEALGDSWNKFVTRKIPIVSGMAEAGFQEKLTAGLRPNQIMAYSMDNDPLSQIQDGTMTGLRGTGVQILEVPLGNVSGAIGERIIIHGNPGASMMESHSLGSFDDPTNTSSRGASGGW